MVYFSIISLFVLASTTIYCLIQTHKNKIIVFVLTPLLVFGSIISYYSFMSLAGSPIKGYPKGDIEVLTSLIMKPDIHITVRHKDTLELKSYLIPFDSINAGTMNREKGLTERGISRSGRFEKNKFGEVRYVVNAPEKTQLPPK